MASTAVIIGATGTVGRGITRAFRARGWDIVAVGRNADTLADFQREAPGTRVICGTVGDDESAIATAAKVSAVAPVINAVITTINMPQTTARLLDTSAENLVEILVGNVISHHCAAKAFLPLLTGGGRYIGIGGGMADVTFAGMGAVSICQAAQRNLFRFLAQETEGEARSVYELMLFSHIVDPVNEQVANPRDIRADEVGAHVLAILESPEVFVGPILTLKTRKQIGLPQRD
jgi:NAD(P)-dependent dehydrogenase (short-subunit alcohol dehydrogenase family)